MVLSRLPVLHYFYSRPPHGGRLRSSCLIEYFWNFYPRPHMEGDTILFLPPGDVRDFYPRPHMEGDIEERFAFPNWGNFYPRPHMEGDCAHQGGPADGATDFYPRPHMEGDEV